MFVMNASHYLHHCQTFPAGAGNGNNTIDQGDGSTVGLVIGVAGGVVLCVLMVIAMLIVSCTIIRLRGKQEATGLSRTSKIITPLSMSLSK